jgi:hypothetical protein
MEQVLGYYSHQSNISAKREAEEYLNIIRIYKGLIINPNQYYNVPNPYQINVYWRVLEKVNYIIVSAVNGKIGRTSFYEVKQGLLQGIPVHEIFAIGRGFKFRKVVGLQIVSKKNLMGYAKLVCIPLKNDPYLKNNSK